MPDPFPPTDAELLVRAAAVRFEDIAPDDPRALAAMTAYFIEVGERFGYQPGEGWQDEVGSMSPPHGRFVLGVSDEPSDRVSAMESIACGGVQPLPDGSAEIKRMWVHPAWRGAGVGGRLLRHLESLARAGGHARVRLDTNDALHEAIALYGRAGYRAIPRYNDNPWARCWFEKDLAAG